MVETRSWPTKVRGKIAIHAAKRKPDEAFPALSGKDVPLGAVVGTAELVDCLPIELLYGGEYDTPDERLYGDWTQGRYGWVLGDVEIFASPIPAIGRQGFWTWEL